MVIRRCWRQHGVRLSADRQGGARCSAIAAVAFSTEIALKRHGAIFGTESPSLPDGAFVAGSDRK